MRKTIKELENELEHKIQTCNDYYSKWQKLEDEKKEKERREMNGIRLENEKFMELTSTLREIIRWQINPETARTPFFPLLKEGDKPLYDKFGGKINY